ncbi:hypothetical protein Daus18300_006161 [Diaporthe australafricana]|uniref:Phosphoglycerate mutase family protein n=1 Tax=Diaporthe australafricana TaxID=127596 RepID=A0ABR3WW46_9PEZI
MDYQVPYPQVPNPQVPGPPAPQQVRISEYTMDKTVSDPVYRETTMKNLKDEVALHPYNFRPFNGFKALRTTPMTSDKKIIYTVRHGDTPHNQDNIVYGKPISWRYLAQLQKNFNPSITEEGIGQAREAANMLAEVIASESAPRPVTIYSSPLRRCVQTAMYMIAKASLDQPGPGDICGPVTLRIKEGLREWMGYNHGHMSDRSDGREALCAQVQQLREELGISPQVVIEVDVPELENFCNETYTDLDRRVRGVLDEMFNDENSGACVMLVVHNRSHKSFLRVLGHTPEAVEEFEIANCAMLPYLVTRQVLEGQGHYQAREARDAVQWQKDLETSEDFKAKRLRQAVVAVRTWNADQSSRHKLQNLWNDLQYHQARGDPAAPPAMELLNNDLGSDPQLSQH